jgi:hypothetical protein
MTEEELFDYLRHNILPDLIPSPHPYSKWDCVSPASKAYFELKCRRRHYEDLILEQSKYDAMMTMGQELGLSPWYVCSTPESIFFFDLIHLRPEWITMDLPQTTDFDRTDNVPKIVALIDNKQAFKIALPYGGTQ